MTNDMQALRRFITAQDEIKYNNVNDSLVVLDFTHSNLQQRHPEVRVDKHAPLSELRRLFHIKTGTSPQFQLLQVLENNTIINEIPPEADDTRPIGYFGLLFHGMRVHCVDLNPLSESRNGGYEDTTLVTKYVMSDEEYNQRKNTLRHWSQEQKEKNPRFSLRQHAREHAAMVEATRLHKQGLPLPEGFFVDATGQIVREEPDVEEEPTDYNVSTVTHAQVGDRCQVTPGQRRGRVAFVGLVPELGGHWVGVVFDEPVGSNNGSVEGRVYFDTPGDRYGGLIRGKHVEVGDFPERDLLDSSDDEF